MRELHWHPNNDEFQYFLTGQGRMTGYAANGTARTFDVRSGSVGYMPFCYGHYIQNTGTTPLWYLEVFKSPIYKDVSLTQWMALTPKFKCWGRGYFILTQDEVGSSKIPTI